MPEIVTIQSSHLNITWDKWGRINTAVLTRRGHRYTGESEIAARAVRLAWDKSVKGASRRRFLRSFWR